MMQSMSTGKRVSLGLHALAHRAYASLSTRPWLTDIGCGLGAMWWGLWVGIHQEAVVHGGFLLFRPVLGGIAAAAALKGLLQLIVAILKLPHARQVVSTFGIALWGGVAIGLQSPSGQAIYCDFALFDLLILIRAF